MKFNKILIDSVGRHPSFHQSQKQLKKLVTLDEEDLKHWKGRINFGKSQYWSSNECMRILLGCRCGRQWFHRGAPVWITEEANCCSFQFWSCIRRQEMQQLARNSVLMKTADRHWASALLLFSPSTK
jgi:hypothetical protein